MRAPGPDVAKQLIAERFPTARGAWLGGSIARGTASATSDLDITVLMADDDEEAPYRHSLVYAEWPVELFVHTTVSFEHFLATDLGRRQPSLARLVAEAELIHGEDVLGPRARDYLAAGPRPLSDSELAAARYGLTDLIDDLVGASHGAFDAERLEATAIATRLWEEALAFLLTAGGRWRGTGKGLVREVWALDPELARSSADALRAALSGSPEPLVEFVDDVLEPYGGRLFDGYYSSAR